MLDLFSYAGVPVPVARASVLRRDPADYVPPRAAAELGLPVSVPPAAAPAPARRRFRVVRFSRPGPEAWFLAALDSRRAARSPDALRSATALVRSARARLVSAGGDPDALSALSAAAAAAA